MPYRERLKGGRKPNTGAKGPATNPPTTNTPVDSRAALPPGALRRPFLGRQGDEHQKPSPEERRALEKIQSAQLDNGKRRV
jgi:hypothetical protein